MAASRKSSSATVPRRKKDAAPDRIDVRDWFYQPTLAPLPETLVNIGRVPRVLDQGEEGACTGFALAAVIHYQLHERGLRRAVSPYMLYHMARRYDEWPGEGYEGSSARGAMKGWLRHGVCEQAEWPSMAKSFRDFDERLARSAQATPCGAFYRVQHRQVRDLHAALHEAGSVFLTLMVHAGWDAPDAALQHEAVSFQQGGRRRRLRLPVIRRQGAADGGHAVALVGYTATGLIVQNSWGKGWGAGGFALLPYDDYLLHAVDAWVVRIGVPLSLDLWTAQRSAELGGKQRAGRAIPLAEIRPYAIDIGNNGRLSDSGDYWTTEQDLRRLFGPLIGERTERWQKRRVLLYLHGGLNDERAAARRIVSFRDVMLQNEIYPVHVMWETGFVETLLNIVADLLGPALDGRAGSWWERVRDGLTEAKDYSFELTVSAPGTALWREMKENAALASAPGGGLALAAQVVQELLARLPPAERRTWELHIVAHSAGAIFVAHALEALMKLGVPIRTIQFLAPAITAAQFTDHVLPAVEHALIPLPTLYVLADKAEKGDSVGPLYDKSLLYLVSNAFEGARGTPLLGMERHLRRSADPASRGLARLWEHYGKAPGDGPPLVIAGGDNASLSNSRTHGGFDNDMATMNSVLAQVLGHRPRRPFAERDLVY
jgi:hypothetical protein